MSYVSLLKNIPEVFSQPTGIAAIASLGLHGAIALIVPLMPVNSSASSKTDSPKAVGLMELSAVDQSRLPQPPQTSQLALPQPQLPLQQQLPGTSLGSPLTNYSPLQRQLSNQPIFPAIPSSSTNYNVSYLPSKSIERLTPNSSQRDMGSLSPRSTYTPSTPSLNQGIPQTESLIVNRLPKVQQSTEIPGEPLNNPSADKIDIGGTTAAGISPPQTMESENNPVKIPQGGEKLALVDNSRGQSSEIPTNQLESKVKKTEQLLAKLNSYNNLRQNIRQEYPNIKEKGVIHETISIDTPEMEGTVIGRLVVDSDGKVLDIKFQEGTESPKLQSKAREFFSANPPQADKQQISSYPFRLKFQNNLNAPGVSSKGQPSATPNNIEKLPESEIKPSATPNTTQKLPESKIKPSATPNTTQKLPESEIKPSATPNTTQKLPESEIKPSATPNTTQKLPESEIKPSATPNTTQKLPESEIKPSATPNTTQKLPESKIKSSAATPTVNNINSVTTPTQTSDARSVSSESNQKLIQFLNQIKKEGKNP
jgi:hypothetical protein